MMKLKKTLYLSLCLVVVLSMLSGCIEEYEADLPAEDSNLLVVEGTIESGKLNKFYLSRAQAVKSSDAPRMVTGAKVSVRGSDGSEYEALETGDYYSCTIEALNPDVEYFLHIEVGSEVYESDPQKPLRTEKIADVTGVQETPASNIDVLVTPEAPFESAKTNYYSWTYDETWEVQPEYRTIVYFNTETLAPEDRFDQFPERGWKNGRSSTIIVGASRNYEGQHIQKLKMYDIARDSERMYYRYSGLLHQRAISKAEYEYELARRQAGSEMGGLFTPLPSSLPTNIRCLTSNNRAIGFVGCSMNTSEYRFFLESTDYSIYQPRRESRFWLEFEGYDEKEYEKFLKKCLNLAENGMYLCLWEDMRESPDGKLRTAWAYLQQLDVRQRGAYVEEPDFWSLKENVSY